jgi:transcriptional regulator with XRE-family HTH domain
MRYGCFPQCEGSNGDKGASALLERFIATSIAEIEDTLMKQTKVIDKHVRARRADLRDAEVGRRVRSRRLECRLSQTELADRIGVTFQQVQKYEKGVNRIGAGRLQRISEALEVPISFFFGGTGGTTAREPASGSESVFGFLQTSGSVRIVKAFHKIKSRKARQLLVEMAEELADAQAA